jgi:hypothetical protein
MAWLPWWLAQGEPCCPMPDAPGAGGEIFICRHRRAWRRCPPWATGAPRRDGMRPSLCWCWRRISRRAALRELTARLRQGLAAFEQPEGRVPGADDEL